MPEQNPKRKVRATVNSNSSKEKDLLELQKLSVKEKWVEKDFTTFISASSALEQLSEIESKKFYELLLKIPQTHLARVLFWVTNERFLEFIKKGTGNRFSFLSNLGEDIEDFVFKWIGIEDNISLFQDDTKAATRKFKSIVAEKLEVRFVKPDKDNRELPWASLKRIDRTRLFYSLIILQSGLNQSRIQQVYQYVLLLIEDFVGGAPSDLDSKLPISATSEFRKLCIFFREIRENTSEETVNNLYRIERVDQSQIEHLTSEKQTLERANQHTKEQVVQLTSQLDDAIKKASSLEQKNNRQQEELKSLHERYRELEASYTRYKETSKIDSATQMNAFLSKLDRELNHEFTKLQRGIDRHIQNEKVKSQFSQIMTKIEKRIKFKDGEE